LREFEIIEHGDMSEKEYKEELLYIFKKIK